MKAFYDVTSFRCLLHGIPDAGTVVPCIQTCTNEHHRVLALVAHVPFPIALVKDRPLPQDAANQELINDDEGRIRVRLADVEQAIWTLWPTATHATVGGENRTVHVFAGKESVREWIESGLDAVRDFFETGDAS